MAKGTTTTGAVKPRSLDVYDLDGNSASLSLIYPGGNARTGVIGEDIRDPQATKWVDALVGDADDVLLDVPGGGIRDLVSVFDDGSGDVNSAVASLIETAKRRDREIVIVSIVGTLDDLILPVQDALEVFGARVHHVVVKNGLYAERADQFVKFDGLLDVESGAEIFPRSETSKMVEAHNGEVVFFPKMKPIAQQVAALNRLSYFEAGDIANEGKMTVRHANDMRTWLRSVADNFSGTWLDPLPQRDTKRVIIMLSQKGGIGKSTIARAFIDIERNAEAFARRHRAIANGSAPRFGPAEAVQHVEAV